MQQLHCAVSRAQIGRRRTHQAREALERARDADARVDLDEDALGRLDVDLQQAGLVQRRVEEREKALISSVETRAALTDLVRDVGPRRRDLTPHPREDALVVVRIQ